MTRVVVDTNVLMAAEQTICADLDTPADLKCQERCSQRLLQLQRAGVTVCVDHAYGIFGEYRRRLLANRSCRGVGSEFCISVMSGSRSCRTEWVSITLSDEARGFEELPPNRLDPSDRKLLAVAVKAGATIINATDSDWDEQSALLERLGVPLEQLCPQHQSKVGKPAR